MFRATSKRDGGERNVYKNNLQRDFAEDSFFKPYHSSAESSLDLQTMRR